MKLLIISHTDHYKNEKGQILGWGSTITELNHLASIFDEIYHVAVFKNDRPPPSSMPYTSKRIHLIPIKQTGGALFYKKLNVIWYAPGTIYKVFRTLGKVDVFQLRTPTGIGVYLIPLLTLFSRKKGWYKYAGNWVQENAPLGYRLQRWMLKHQTRKVTLNGKWEGQLKHCYTFENPCLTEQQRIEGLELIKNKKFIKPYSFCFVGRLEDPKGVGRILEAFGKLKDPGSIKEIHFIGDGRKMQEYRNLADKIDVKVKFHGFISFLEVFEVLKNAHFFLLPSSASEGFPKVIAEAMNFGCIPIVSNVSSIEQYVKNQFNGFIVNPITSESLLEILEELIEYNLKDLQEIALRNHKVTKNFTYENYLERIKNDIVA